MSFPDKELLIIKWTLCQGHFKKRDLEREIFFNILVSRRQYDTKTLAIAS
jgi:hypothetical protein